MKLFKLWLKFSKLATIIGLAFLIYTAISLDSNNQETYVKIKEIGDTGYLLVSIGLILLYLTILVRTYFTVER
jgi:hypothetical protein